MVNYRLVACKPEIDIIHGNVFEYDYEQLAKSTSHLKTLVIGNPPWVTNSKLGSIDSKIFLKNQILKNIMDLMQLQEKEILILESIFL